MGVRVFTTRDTKKMPATLKLWQVAQLIEGFDDAKRLASLRDVVDRTTTTQWRPWEGRTYVIRDGATRLRLGVRGHNATWECIYEGTAASPPDDALALAAVLKDRFARR